jgi:thiamine biosynthesis lipoprotein
MLSAESMPSPARAGTAPGRPLRRLRIAMGTWVTIEAAAESEATAAGALEAAFAAISEVEWRMHPEREGSDIARINSAPLLVQTPIHASTWEVLRLAQRLHELTRGVFDPCLPLRTGCLTDLRLSKGYAIDRAVAALRAGGCHAGAVNAGGDLRLFGARRDTILLRHGDRSYQPLVVQNAALAVSDLDETRRPPGHRGYYVRTDAARASRRYAAVLARDAMIADALTKCVLLCSEERASRTVAEWGARIVTEAGRGPDC